MTSQQHRQPVSTEVVHYFRNQNTTTFPKDHCCIIICRLRGLSSSILSNRSVLVLGGRVFCFILCFWCSLAPPPSPIDVPRPPPASPPVVIQFWEGDCCLSMRYINTYHHPLRLISLPLPPPRTRPHIA